MSTAVATTTTTTTTTTTSATEHDSAALGSVVSAQLASLDDADDHASAWADALASAAAASSVASWGGRGRGGRGLARRTYQPLDISVEGVSLEYVGDPSVVGSGRGGGGSSKILLENATLRLLPGRVYAVVGRNGCGKSTLLRRIDAGKIPGFPSHVTTLCVPQEVFGSESTPAEIVLRHHRRLARTAAEANRAEIERLEGALEALDVEDEEDRGRIEELCERIGRLEGEAGGGGGGDGDGGEGDDDNDDEEARKRAEESLRYFGVPDSDLDVPTSRLSGGLRKKVALACALFYRPRLLLLDEPTNHQDVSGILRLRRLIASCVEDGSATVVLVSHDVDLIDDAATDVIHFHDRTLRYYPGNYRDFLGYRRQGLTHALRQADRLDRQRTAMMSTIDNLKKQSAGSKSVGERKKIRRQIESRKKKLERHGVERDERGHRWTAQKAGTGIRPGSINSLDASSRAKLGHRQLLKRGETSVAPVPDKAVQFEFRDVTCAWGEPLVMAMDVGHGYGTDKGAGVGGGGDSGVPSSSAAEGPDGGTPADPRIKAPGMLFDCVDLCIDEGSTTCILGSNGSGKSTLLRILAGTERPREGKVHRAHGLCAGYFSQHVADEMIERRGGRSSPPSAGTARMMATPLSVLSELFPAKSEQDLRGELTAFGLDPVRAVTNVRFLSGGERTRLCLTSIMLRDPQLLLLDEVTNHLDVESVDALAHGIKKWNGTVVMVTHDANLIRKVGGTCYVLVEDEGKLRKVPGGIDSYLRAFRL